MHYTNNNNNNNINSNKKKKNNKSDNNNILYKMAHSNIHHRRHHHHYDHNDHHRRRRTWPLSLLLVISVMSDMTNGGVQGPIEGYNSLDDMTTTYAPTAAFTHPKWLEPYFDPSTPRNVTALMGKSAYLSCRVRNLGNKTVSWIRHRDIHILTVGSYTYTSDQRFQATHHQDTDDWTLQIKWAQKRDAGMYECQISTQPVRSYFVRLNVVVPTATILGGPDLHVDKGSTINLTCTVKFSPEPPAYIFWYHHDEVINYDSSRGGVSVITEKGDVTTSFLLIQNADLADSGKYSCAPSNADVASVRVHVLNGEHPEAMQTGSSGCQYSWLTIVMLVGLVLCYNNHQQQPQLQQGRANKTLTMTTNNISNNNNNTTSKRRRNNNSSNPRESSASCIMSSKSFHSNNSNDIITTTTTTTTEAAVAAADTTDVDPVVFAAATVAPVAAAATAVINNVVAVATECRLSTVEVNSCCQLSKAAATTCNKIGCYRGKRDDNENNDTVDEGSDDGDAIVCGSCDPETRSTPPTSNCNR